MPAIINGGSTALSEDLIALLDRLELARVHVVGAKIGGTISLRLAAIIGSRRSRSPPWSAGFTLRSSRTGRPHGASKSVSMV